MRLRSATLIYKRLRYGLMSDNYVEQRFFLTPTGRNSRFALARIRSRPTDRIARKRIHACLNLTVLEASSGGRRGNRKHPTHSAATDGGVPRTSAPLAIVPGSSKWGIPR